MTEAGSSARGRAERPRLGGRVDPAFRRVGEVFAERLADAELGAAVSVFVDGRSVVDLWGGFADRRRERPWRRDTLVCCFSATKVPTALALLDAVAGGELELDEPLALHWPEFAGDGRETITLRHVLSHRAGLPGWRRDAGLAPEDLLDGARMAAALAREQPFWTPGEAHGYHARSYGFLLAEVLRRATGESVGARLRRRLTGPCDLDFHLGLDARAMERCADLVPAPAGTAVPAASRPMLAAMADADSVTAAAFAVPPQGRGATNSAAWRAAELPAMNGHCTARGLAGIYAGVLEGSMLPASLSEEAWRVHSEGEDRVLLQPTTFGLGFMCSRRTLPVGLGDTSVGHAGAGGSVGFADRESGVAFAFVMNRMRPGAVTGNDSALALVEAVRTALS